MIKILQAISIFIIPLFGYSQTGPGGVGSSDGSSTLELWLIADIGVTTSGTTVTAWTDQSGNGNNVSTIGGDPSQTTTINGYGVISLDGNDYLQSTVSSNTGNVASAYVAATITGYSGVFWNGILSGSVAGQLDYNSVNRVCFLLRGNTTNNLVSYRAGGKGSITNGLSGSALKIMGSDYDGSNNIVRLDGTPSSPVASTGSFNFNLIGIGKRITQNFFTIGDYAEVIYFSTTLNEAQKIIIENYLQAKYNGTSTSTLNIYDEDDAANGNYDHDVAGIGRVDASNIHNDAQGNGIVRIMNPTELGDDEFLLWGHDNGVQQATNTTDVPTGVQARFDRVWRASEANSSGTAVDVGAINLRFDLAGLGPVTASDLRLLVDTDNDGDFSDETPISGATSIGGDVYQFAGVTAIANNLRFTLGTINTYQTPLPIELVNFEVKRIENGQVGIYWQTASEINKDYFTIEKSKDAEKWHTLKTIEGAGNSSTILSYSTIDENTHLGTSYYRLKQTDFDGQFEYSQIRSVNIEGEINSQIHVYPNPAENSVIIIGDEFELNQLKIFNMLEQDVTALTSMNNINATKLIIDLSNLSQGMYWIKTKTTANKVYKQ